LINLFREADIRINELSASLVDAVTEQVREEQQLLNRFLLLLRPSVRERIASHSANLRYLSIHITGAVKQRLIKETGSVNRRNDKLQIAAREFLNQCKHTIEMLDKKNGYLDPFLILKRGYSITYHKGRAIKDPAMVSPDEIIETRLAGGVLFSKTT
jgi:exodeoxyribonuclease VII large subunit